MDQVNVVLDKVLETCNYFKIKACQFNLSLAIDNLLGCQLSLLLF